MDLFNLHNADNHKYPVIVSIPHSGTFVPNEIRSGMLPSVVLSNVDWFLKELYDFLPDMGITVISSNISRYVIDLNRDKTEDINGEDFWTKLVHTHNTFGKPLYSRPLCSDEIQERLKQYYDPYHTALKKLIEEKLRFYNKVLLLDLHSFCVDFIEGANEDISLSNYNHQSSTTQSIEALRDILAKQGYKVGINVIRGRYILKNYKRIFKDNIDCIQVELRYSQYIDNRYYGEEELNSWNAALFIDAKTKLRIAFTKLFNEMEGKNEF